MVTFPRIQARQNRHRPALANQRFKARYRVLFWAGVLASAIVHGVVLWLSPTLGELPTWRSIAERLELTPPVDTRSAPEPPPFIEPPRLGPFGQARFEEVPKPAAPLVEEVREPPVANVLRELMDSPSFTPYEVAPELKNRAAVVDAVLRSYPYESPGVPDRIRTVLWFLIDEYGVVRRTLVKESSGHAAVDTAMLKVAALAEFSPAWSGDRNIPVWISLPIVFRVEPLNAGAADTMSVADTTGIAEPTVRRG